MASKIRSSGNQLKFKNSVKEYENDPIKDKSLIGKHKKSKSQTAIMGINIDNKNNSHQDAQEESTYTTQIKVNTKRAI